MQEFTTNCLAVHDQGQNINKTIIMLILDEGNRGAVVLYEILVQKGFSCKFVYFLVDDNENKLALKNLILKSDTMLIGFSFASQSTQVAFNLSKYLSVECPSIPIVFGGIHPTVDPMSCIDHCDALCIGEGELTILEIVDLISKGENYLTAKNLMYKTDTGIIQNNALYPLIENLDSLPLRRPYTEDYIIIKNGIAVSVDKHRYFEIIPIARTCYIQNFSRGCPYACDYCCNSVYKDIYPKWSKIRTMSVSSTINEIIENIKINPEIIKIFIIDDCFLAHNGSWLLEFTELWREKVNKELNFYTIPEYVKREKLEILKTIDLCYCSVGLQSGSTKTNAFYNRKFSRKRFLEACDTIRLMGLGLVVNVIFDNPWEEDEDIFETIDVLTDIKKPYYIIQYSLKIYPGSKMHKKFQDVGYTIPDFNLWYSNFSVIQPTDANKAIILAQFLPKKMLIYLFKNRYSNWVKVLLRIIYFSACLIMPLHTLRICGSKSLKRNFLIAFSFKKHAIRYVKGLLGFV